MLAKVFPVVADSRYPGQRLGLWLFALMPIKIAMGLNVMLNAPQVARSADGIPVDSFNPPAAAAFLFAFAAWGLCQFVLGATSLVVLLRYRSLIPLAFLALLAEQGGRMLLRHYWPVERISTAPGTSINIALAIIMTTGFVLSILSPRATQDGDR